MKLHVGCGPVILDGWENLDIAGKPPVINCDVREGLNYDANSVEAIYSVHFIEHLSAPYSAQFLRECHRVLKPGRPIRLLAPDLAMAVRAYTEGEKYWRSVWPINPGDGLSRAEIFNWFAYDGGHRQLLDGELLAKQLTAAGFERATRMAMHDFGYDVFKGLPEFPNESLVMEARKPGNIKFGVRIPTYHRADGSSKEKVLRAIASVKRQTYTDWQLFIVGDCYEPQEEFDEIVREAGEGVVSVNLNRALEREKYEGERLWCYGGVNAMNTAIDAMHEYGIRYCACLDHDDIWHDDHLDAVADALCEYPEAVFVYTKGEDAAGAIVPDNNVELGYDNLPPVGCCAFHSALVWDIQRLPLRYRNLALHGVDKPADADLLDRAREYCKRHGLKTLHMPRITITHT